MSYITRTLLAALTGAILLLPGCATSGRNFFDTSRSDAINGRVVEKTTNQPVPGAIVAVLWTAHAGYSGQICYHVETTTTDAQGEYHIPAWERPSPNGDLPNGRLNMMVYKPGYEYLYPQDINYRAPPDTLFVKRFSGTVGERIDILLRVLGSTSCGASDKSDQNLLPLRKSLYNEALQYPRDVKKALPGEMNFQDTFLYDIEILQFGYEKATKRLQERVGQ